jgi:hypothetical protein
MFDASRWRERAEQSRVHAEQTTDRVAREIMLEIARAYETLAQKAEESAAPKRPADFGSPLLT